MPDTFECLPARWTSDEAKATFDILEARQMEIIKTFTVPAEMLGVIMPDRYAEMQRKIIETTNRLVDEMCGIYIQYAAPQARVKRTCECRGVLHDSGCPEGPV